MAIGICNPITAAYDVTIRGKSVTVWKGNFVQVPVLLVKDFWVKSPLILPREQAV